MARGPASGPEDAAERGVEDGRETASVVAPEALPAEGEPTETIPRSRQDPKILGRDDAEVV